MHRAGRTIRAGETQHPGSGIVQVPDCRGSEWPLAYCPGDFFRGIECYLALAKLGYKGCGCRELALSERMPGIETASDGSHRRISGGNAGFSINAEHAAW